jgi:hypothetical protein
MTKPHKHADLIKAWADGQEIEVSNDNSRWCVVDRPSWSDSLLYRIKPAAPVVKWQAEREAYARGEQVQWRYPSVPWSVEWVDSTKATNLPAFDVPGYEFRIKPKTTKTRIRVAAMGEPNGKGGTWVWPVHTDDHAAQTERNGHFLCWLGDWHEVERPEPPVEDTLSVGHITAAKISAATITTAKTALGAAQAMGFDRAKRDGSRAAIWWYTQPVGGCPHVYKGSR